MIKVNSYRSYINNLLIKEEVYASARSRPRPSAHTFFISFEMKCTLLHRLLVRNFNVVFII